MSTIWFGIYVTFGISSLYRRRRRRGRASRCGGCFPCIYDAEVVYIDAIWKLFTFYTEVWHKVSFARDDFCTKIKCVVVKQRSKSRPASIQSSFIHSPRAVLSSGEQKTRRGRRPVTFSGTYWHHTWVVVQPKTNVALTDLHTCTGHYYRCVLYVLSNCICICYKLLCC